MKFGGIAFALAIAAVGVWETDAWPNLLQMGVWSSLSRNSHSSGYRLNEDIKVETFYVCTPATKPISASDNLRSSGDYPKVYSMTSETQNAVSINGSRYESPWISQLGGINEAADLKGFCVPRFSADLRFEQQGQATYPNGAGADKNWGDCGPMSCCQHISASACLSDGRLQPSHANSEEPTNTEPAARQHQVRKCVWVRDDEQQTHNSPGCGNRGIPEQYVKITVVDHIQTTNEVPYTNASGYGSLDGNYAYPDSPTSSQASILYTFNDIDFARPNPVRRPTRCSSALTANKLYDSPTPTPTGSPTSHMDDPYERMQNMMYKDETHLARYNIIADRQITEDSSVARQRRCAELRQVTSHSCLGFDEANCAAAAGFTGACKWASVGQKDPMCADHDSNPYGRCVKDDLQEYVKLQQARKANTFVSNTTLYRNSRDRVTPDYVSTMRCFEDSPHNTESQTHDKGAVNIAKVDLKCDVNNPQDLACQNLQATYSCGSGQEPHHSIRVKNHQPIGERPIGGDISMKRSGSIWSIKSIDIVSLDGTDVNVLINDPNAAASMSNFPVSTYYKRTRVATMTLQEFLGRYSVDAQPESGSGTKLNVVLGNGAMQRRENVNMMPRMFGLKWDSSNAMVDTSGTPIEIGTDKVDENGVSYPGRTAGQTVEFGGCVPLKSDFPGDTDFATTGVDTDEIATVTVSATDNHKIQIHGHIYTTTTHVTDSLDRMRNVPAENNKYLPQSQVRTSVGSTAYDINVNLKLSSYALQHVRTVKAMSTVMLSDARVKLHSPDDVKTRVAGNQGQIAGLSQIMTSNNGREYLTLGQQLISKDHVFTNANVEFYEIGYVDIITDVVTINQLLMPYGITDIKTMQRVQHNINNLLTQNGADANRYSLDYWSGDAQEGLPEDDRCRIVLARADEDYTAASFVEAHTNNILDDNVTSGFQVVYARQTYGSGIPGHNHLYSHDGSGESNTVNATDHHTHVNRHSTQKQIQTSQRLKNRLRLLVKKTSNGKDCALDRDSQLVGGAFYVGDAPKSASGPVVGASNLNVFVADITDTMSQIVKPSMEERDEHDYFDALSHVCKSLERAKNKTPARVTDTTYNACVTAESTNQVYNMIETSGIAVPADGANDMYTYTGTHHGCVADNGSTGDAEYPNTSVNHDQGTFTRGLTRCNMDKLVTNWMYWWGVDYVDMPDDWHRNSGNKATYPGAVFTLPQISFNIPSANEATSVAINSFLEIAVPELTITRIASGAEDVFPLTNNTGTFGVRSWDQLSVADLIAESKKAGSTLKLQTYRVDAEAVINPEEGSKPPVMAGAISGQDIITFPTRVKPYTATSGATGETGKCSFDERFLVSCVTNTRKDLVSSTALSHVAGESKCSQTEITSGKCARVSNHGCGAITTKNEGAVILLWYKSLEELSNVYPHWFADLSDVKNTLKLATRYADGFIVDYSERSHRFDSSTGDTMANPRDAPRAHTTQEQDFATVYQRTTAAVKPFAAFSPRSPTDSNYSSTVFSYAKTDMHTPDASHSNVFLGTSGNKTVNTIKQKSGTDTLNACEFAFVFSLPSILSNPVIDTSYSGVDFDTTIMLETGVFVQVDHDSSAGRRTGELVQRRALLQTSGSSTSSTTSSGASLTYNPTFDLKTEACDANSQSHLKITVDGAQAVCVKSIDVTTSDTKGEVEDTKDGVQRNMILMIILIALATMLLIGVSLMAFVQYRTHRMTWELNTMLSGSPMPRRPRQAEAGAEPSTNPVVERAVNRGRFM